MRALSIFLIAMTAGCSATFAIRRAEVIDPEKISLPAFSEESYGAADSYEHYIRSTVFEERGEIEQAASEMAKAIKGDPSDSHLRVRFAGLLLRMGDIDRAARQVARALTLDPASSAAWTALADVQMQSNDPRRAVQAAQNAIRIAPSQPEGYLWLARYHFNNGDTDRALLRAGDLLQLHPDSIEGNLMAYEWLNAKGLTHQADVHLFRYLAQTGGSPELVLDAALRLKAQGDIPGAVLRLERLLEKTPGFDRAREALIDILIDAGLRRRACAHIDTYGSGADDVDTVTVRVRMYLRARAPWQAREELDRLAGEELNDEETIAMSNQIDAELGLRPVAPSPSNSAP